MTNNRSNMALCKNVAYNSSMSAAKLIKLPGGSIKVKQPKVKSDINKAIKILNIISSTANASA